MDIRKDNRILDNFSESFKIYGKGSKLTNWDEIFVFWVLHALVYEISIIKQNTVIDFCWW